MDKAAAKNVKVHLPVDFVTGEDYKKDTKVGAATVESGIADGQMGLDVGPVSVKQFNDVVSKAKLILWNG